MEKCFIHRNGCHRVWEIYIGQRQPVCGQGGFLLNSDGETQRWNTIGEAVQTAIDMGHRELEIVGV